LKLAGIVRTCFYFNQCGESEIHNGIKWQEHWHKFKDGVICEKHYLKITANQKRSKEKIREYNCKIYKFKNKSFRLNKNPRIGFCSWCPNNIFDGSCKRTSMHHWVYIIIFPWFGTEEVCNSCHKKEHDIINIRWRNKK
jgi:hypothetical protein